jgi:predicted nuclease of restriction endonuclease-like RecB superfamily
MRTKAVQIQVDDPRDVELIVTGLEDDAVRAFVKVMGALLPLNPQERERVLRFVADHFGLRS